MKPEAKKTAVTTRRSDGEGGSSPFNLSSLKQAIDGCSSPFNLSSLKHAIETIDVSKETTADLSSLSSALSSAIRKMKQTDTYQLKRERYLKAKKKKKKKKKKVVIGMKPETNKELRRWFENFDETFKESLMKRKNDIQAYKVTPKTAFKEPQICEFNTDFTWRHFDL